MKILCPTDFSDHSKLALHYAVDLTNKTKGELHIISAYPIIDNANTLTSVDSALEEEYTSKMKELVNGIFPLMQTDQLPTSIIFKGSPEQVILEYVEKNEIDIIVMGTQGINSIRTLFFGSTTKRIVNKAGIPVLAIPETMDKGMMEKTLLLALDDRILEDGTIFNVPLTIAKNLGVKIDIIHVDKKEKVVPYDPFISSYLGKSIGEVILETTYKDPIRVIKSYSENGNYGMIIMVHRSRSFFQRLFLDSNSAQEVEIINVPLLILPDHLNDKDHAQ